MLELLKKGNKSSGIAALGNAGLAVAKGIAAAISGSGAMFATTIHSIADATNQGFVFFGSALAEKEPTEKFPAGFGRVVNLFVLVAVVVISIMAYETIIKGWHFIQNPSEATHLWLNIGILTLSIMVDGYILWKAMKEIAEESRTEASGFSVIPEAFRHLQYASPPTRLVFYEDIVATSGAFLALISILLAHFTGFLLLDGIGTMLIGILLIGIALKIGYDNTIGLIGVAAPAKIENRIAELILDEPQVVDISEMKVIQVGRQYHVDSYIELTEGLSLEKADDIKIKVQNKILKDPDIDDVTLGILESDDKKSWEERKPSN
ncbi:cation transporter [Virgibacillus sp. MSP4-1]|uniref:cation diffusion facilitator family transporter n=1 Tax=Virgibacillus sp. MSP4-1 TaxID=2700081 RepID=UPI0003A6662F|nr:cation diffusion facilitator family transporter [Virgibacillus sp. MSP4-1]QHS22473.1 cation transporter [Virgibacillus sp. MSP4-1]